MMRKVLPVFLLFGLIWLLTFSTAVRAQTDFPSRPIKMVVPFPPGGEIDVTARIAAQALTDILGQQVIVQNQGGAGGAIATDSS